MGVGTGDALFMPKEDSNEKNTVKKNKGVLHGFRNSVYCNKINTLHNTAPPLSSFSSSSRSFLPPSHDIKSYYEATEACITPSMVRAGFEEIDGIIECGPQAGEEEYSIVLCTLFFFFFSL